MAVRLRMKKLGRRHRPFFRICAMDSRTARDGKVIEELGFYDPMVRETDARARLNNDRIDYWLGVGAQPTEKVKVLIKKYGSSGTHLEQQRAALERLQSVQRPATEQKQLKQEKGESAEPAAEQTPEAAAESGEANE